MVVAGKRRKKGKVRYRKREGGKGEIKATNGRGLGKAWQVLSLAILHVGCHVRRSNHSSVTPCFGVDRMSCICIWLLLDRDVPRAGLWVSIQEPSGNGF
jgi:hypothetical protein